jgi:hypothetical protein
VLHSSSHVDGILHWSERDTGEGKIRRAARERSRVRVLGNIWSFLGFGVVFGAKVSKLHHLLVQKFLHSIAVTNVTTNEPYSAAAICSHH